MKQYSPLVVVGLLFGCGSGLQEPLYATSEDGLRVTDRVRTRGELANATFSSFDPVACLQSDVQLDVNRTTSRTNADPRQVDEFAFLATIRVVTCSGEPIVVGQGIATSIRFDLAPNVRRARLEVPSFPFTDFTHSVDMNLAVDSRWEAEGPTQTEFTTERTVDPDTGATNIQRYAAIFANAVATGVVSNGTDNWIPEPSVTGDLRHETLVSVTRAPR